MVELIVKSHASSGIDDGSYFDDTHIGRSHTLVLPLRSIELCHLLGKSQGNGLALHPLPRPDLAKIFKPILMTKR